MQQERPLQLSWKEKMAGWVLLFIGFLFLSMQLLDYISSREDRISIQREQLSMNVGKLLADLKTYLIIILALTGGWLLLRRNRWGWIIAVPVFFWYGLLCSNGLFVALSVSAFEFSMIFLLLALCIILLCLTLLLLPGALARYRVQKRSWFPVILFLAIIIALHFA